MRIVHRTEIHVQALELKLAAKSVEMIQSRDSLPDQGPQKSIPVHKFFSGGGPTGIAAGDFTGDGDLDLAVLNNQKLTVFLNLR